MLWNSIGRGLTAGVAVLLGFGGLACAPDDTLDEVGVDASETEGGGTTGDGDGDPATSDGGGDGDGDGDPTTGDGDGDGDPTTGDGDGDPTTGDGDGDEPSACAPTQPLEMIADQGNRRLYRYDTIVDDSTFAIAAVDTPEQSQYLDWLDELDEQFPDVDVFDQYALLARQRDIFVNADLDDGAVWDALIDGEIGQITDVICLHSIIFNQQNMDWPVWEEGSEAGAAVLTRDLGNDQTELRMYVVTQDGLPGIWDNGYIDLAAADLALDEGWSFYAHFHNHFYSTDNPTDVSGTTVPSGADISAYLTFAQLYDIEQAWLTNGIHSLVLQASEFETLSQL